MLRHRCRSSSLVRSLLPIWIGIALLLAGPPLPVRALPSVAPARPSITQISELGGPLGAVLVNGNYAYVREGNMLVVLDVRDPEQPVMVGSLQVPFGKAQLVGDLLYVAAGDLQVIDVHNPRLPQLVGVLATPGDARDIAVAGSVAYVADGSAGMEIISLSDPRTPRLITSFTDGSSAYALWYADHQVYVAAGDAGLRIVDVADPQHPIARGSLALDGNALDVAVANGVAYIAAAATSASAGNGGLALIDVSDPAMPRLLNQYTSTPRGATAVEIVGTLAFVTTGNLEILDVADPANILPRGNFNVSGAFTVAGTRLYGVNQGINIDLLYIADVSDADAPTLLGYYDTIGYALDVQRIGNTLYLSDIERGFWIIDVRDPARPLRRGAIGLPDPARDIEIGGTTAYLLISSVLLIVDIADLADPELIGYYEGIRDAQEIKVVGDRVYIAGGGDGLLILDIARPDAPRLMGRYLTTGPAFSLEVSTGRVYLAVGGVGLQILDVSNGARPKLLGQYTASGGARDVELRDTTAFVLLENTGFVTLDVTRANAPKLLGSTPTGGINVELSLSNGIAYATEYTRIELIDIADLDAPVVRGTYQRVLPGGSAGNVVANNNVAYVADAQAGLKILSVRPLPYATLLPLVPR